MHDRRNDSTDPHHHDSVEQDPRRAGAHSPPLGGEERVGETEGGSSRLPPNAFDRQFLETFSRREPAPAVPEADNAGPWRVTTLHGGADPQWGCIAAGERPPRFVFREPDLAHLANAGLALADRPARFRFQVDAAGTLHLMHDGYPVGTAARESDQLPTIRTAFADLRARPDALAHFLLAVPDEVLRRCGVILARMAPDDM
jgi:hypothetical protein